MKLPSNTNNRELAFLSEMLSPAKVPSSIFGLKEDQVPLIIIQHTDGKKFFKPNLEPDHLAARLKAYKVEAQCECNLSVHVLYAQSVPNDNIFYYFRCNWIGGS